MRGEGRDDGKGGEEETKESGRGKNEKDADERER